MTEQPLIRITQLSRSYGGVRALQDVDLEVVRGEVHAICGENGAGKSTLIKVLTGVAAPDQGQIFVGGKRLECGYVTVSEAAGIAVMHQESTVFPDLNALDNIYVGREPSYCGGWLLDHGAMRRGARAILDRLGEALDFDVPVRDLSLAQRQIVALARALSRNCRLLIMDEPTASLSTRETQTLLNIIRQLRSDGISVLYVSHRLEEIFQIADRVTVLRDGQRVATFAIGDVDADQLIQCMVGREVDALTRRHDRDARIGEVVLEVCQLTRTGVFEQISFSVRSGEIVGLGGLVGAGRTEVARAIFGIDGYDSGWVQVAQQPLLPGSVRAAMAAGVALVPEDRQHEGLVLPMSVGENLSLAMLPTLRRGVFVSRRREMALVEQQMRQLMIRSDGADIAAATLSGGNQQKLVLGKWLAMEPKVLILDEPTRGIDVRAKAQVHRLIRELADNGVATLLISSELSELLAISDRIFVLRQGRLVGELDGRTATQARVLALALPDALKRAETFGQPGGAVGRPATARGRPDAPDFGRDHPLSSARRFVRQMLRRRESGLVLLIVLIFSVVSLVDPRFLAWGNLQDLLVRSAPTAIVACGVMLVIVTAEIDISVGSLMAFLAAVMGLMISKNEWNWPTSVGIPLTLLLGTLIGLGTGALVSFGKVPSIIVTLGLLSALRGITMLIMGGENIDELPEPLTRMAKEGIWGLPLGVWIAAVVVLGTGTILNHTPLGRRLFALGSSSYSARMSGLSERRLKLFVFAYTGFVTALATIVDVPRLPKIEAGIGLELELLVITCVVVGGVSISGGRGTLTGVLLAVFLMTLVRPVLTFLDVGEAGEKWTKAIQGLFIVLAMVSDNIFRRRSDYRWRGPSNASIAPSH